MSFVPEFCFIFLWIIFYVSIVRKAMCWLIMNWLRNQSTTNNCPIAFTRNNMDPLAGMDDSSTDDDTASQTTEDDPQVPENQTVLPPPSVPPGVQVIPQPPPPASSNLHRERPHYALRHTLRGHTLSIASVKFSPDGMLLASCGSLVFSCSFFSFLLVTFLLQAQRTS